ncbi:serine/threonine-protein kinase LATS1 [Lates japonicus]|uniref:non-specific serine/threonine protein kinase n=1 Tax=Lates japonicus TaxID=270547 RepID=A0AAD3RKJ4_LATJO|nr:serine/threonine-protein kinase LATS1 [Lates japonicus]
MKRGEKPEGYRQMRPKTFPTSNYSGNSQQMLQEIRDSLRNLSRLSDQPKVDIGGAGKMLPEDPRQQGRCSKNPHHKTLQEIRKSLLPYANEPNCSGPEVNKHMLLEPPCAAFEELSNGRNMGVAIDYMGKVTYQDPMREQMAAANPNTTGMKAPVGPSHMQQSVLRRPSWKGSKESLATRHGPIMAEGMMYRSDSPGPPPAFPQSHPANSQRVNPPLPPQVRSVTPPPNRSAMPPVSSWDNNPSTKRYSGNMDYLVHRISPVPQVGWPDGYSAAVPQNQRGISSAHQPIIMPSSGGSPPQSWSQPPLASSQSQSSSGNSSNQDLSPSWQHNMPNRSNSFNNHQLNGRAAHPASSQPSATTVTAITQAPILQPVKSMRVHKPELLTAVAPTHPPWMQQAPPPPAAPAYPEPPAPVPQIPVVAEAPSYQGPPPPYPKHLLQQAAPCPPAYDPGANKLGSGRDEPAEEEGGGGGGGGSSGGDSSRDKTAENPKSTAAMEKEKKQITTSPVPVRRNKKDEERRGESGRIALYSPQAFKFFMEQHVENILKNHQQRIRRRKQLESEMQRVGLSSEAQEQMRMMLCQKESNYIRLKRAKMDKSMFKRIKTLGIGAFGEVCLARKEDTGALYAMKTLRKKDVLLRNQVAHVKAERDILAEADNEWVVRLYYSFQDKDNLYFVMEYIPGDRDGHIKLTDFGLCTGFRWTHDSKYYQSGDHVRQDSMDFSKEWEDPANCRCTDRLKPLERRKARQHQRCLAHSLVGTPNYIAPEVLLRTATTPLETQLKVINWKSTLHIPPPAKLSPEASDLIVKLCRGPEDRLGKNGADEIKAHPFFKTIDYSSDLRQQAAPYVPTIAHSTDTSNFDPVDPDKLWSSDGDGEDNRNDTLNGWFRNGKHPEHAFYEFTFRRFFDDNGHPYSCPKPIEYEGYNEDEADSEGPAQEASRSSATQGRDLVYV